MAWSAIAARHERRWPGAPDARVIYLRSEHNASLDLKANRKLVLDTTIVRLEERYFRGMSSDCLNVADDGPDVPRRRFQIDKAVPDRCATASVSVSRSCRFPAACWKIESAAARPLI